jgi:hypothetical protein
MDCCGGTRTRTRRERAGRSAAVAMDGCREKGYGRTTFICFGSLSLAIGSARRKFKNTSNSISFYKNITRFKIISEVIGIGGQGLVAIRWPLAF